MPRKLTLAALSLVALAGAADLLVVATPVAAATTTPVTAVSRQWVNVRSGAAVTYPSVGNLVTNQPVTVLCQAVGGLVKGPGGATDKWDFLGAGRYVSDSYLTGHSAVPAPCAPPRVLTADEAAFLAAVAEPARRNMAENRVPASVTIAQAILESGWGRSDIARTARNYFGAKCTTAGPGALAMGCSSFPTRECGTAGCSMTTGSFRVYASVLDSIHDHALILTKARYAPAFAYPAQPDRFAAEIAKAGYATDPAYPSLLTNLMVKYDLYRYDF